MRDLGDSAPYFHNGSQTTLAEVLTAYQDVARLARKQQVRNADPELKRIVLADPDLTNLQAFLRSLKEDYQ